MNNKIFTLKEGDDHRTIRIQITNGDAPQTAVLVLSSSVTGVRVEKDLELESATGDWLYTFTDDDFVELTAGQTRNLVYKAEMYATYSDGTNATFPTTGTMQVKILQKL